MDTWLLVLLICVGSIILAPFVLAIGWRMFLAGAILWMDTWDLMLPGRKPWRCSHAERVGWNARSLLRMNKRNV